MGAGSQVVPAHSYFTTRTTTSSAPVDAYECYIRSKGLPDIPFHCDSWMAVRARHTRGSTALVAYSAPY